MSGYFICPYKKIYGFCIVLLCTVFCLGPVAEAVEKSGKKPKVALVLGGGGARGAAHIGVIQVLEELQIPVDIVVGTSMGAIVGGFYASGFSTEELEEMMHMDWDSAFQDAPPLEDLPFRRKQELKRYVFANKVGIKGGKIQVPPGLIQGQTQIMALKKLAIPTYKITDFDELKIPFRAVATDIVDLEQVVLGSGDLATAIRASMTVPGVFAPVKLNGRILVDGGLVNNVPADVAEAMGAKVLIVVDVGTPYTSREKLSSVTGVTDQLSRYLVRENTDEQFERIKAGGTGTRTIIIRPDLGKLSSADFKNADEAIVKGRDAALALADDLKSLSVSSEEIEGWLKKQRRKPLEPIKIDYIKVKNNSAMSITVIKKCFRLSPGDILDIEELEEDIGELYGMGYFERIEYSLVETSGDTGLILDIVEKTWGPDYLSFGFNLSSDFNGNSTYNIRANYTKTCINKLGAEWRNEVMFGEPSGFYTEFYQPLNHPVGFFISPSFKYSDQRLGVYSSGDEIARYRAKNNKTRLDFGYSIGSYGEIRAGGVYNSGKLRVAIGDPVFDPYDYIRSGLSVVFNYDTYDSISFVNYGSRAVVEFESDQESMGSDASVNTLGFDWSGARTWGRYSFVPGIKINSTLDDDNSPFQYKSFVGGFLNLSGYAQDELVGSHTGVARLVFYRRIGKSEKRPFYIGCSAEVGNAWDYHDDISFDSLLGSGSVFIGKDTFLGHFYLASGFAEGGRNLFYFSLGQVY